MREGQQLHAVKMATSCSLGVLTFVIIYSLFGYSLMALYFNVLTLLLFAVRAYWIWI